MSEELERVYTINLGKVVLSPDNRRSKRAINMIRDFARHHMKTEQVKIDEDLAHQVWKRGIRSPPRKIRVKITKTDEGYVLISPYEEALAEEESKEKKKKLEKTEEETEVKETQEEKEEKPEEPKEEKIKEKQKELTEDKQKEIKTQPKAKEAKPAEKKESPKTKKSKEKAKKTKSKEKSN